MLKHAFALGGLVLAVAQLHAQGPQTADEIMKLVRERTGIAREKIPATGLELNGKGRFTGMPAEFTLLFDREGRYVQSTKARISITQGFDGKDAWMQDLGGEARVLELAERRANLFNGLLVTGLWIDPGSGMSYKLVESAATATWTLEFSHAASELNGQITIDRATGLPASCSFTSEGRPTGYRWSEVIECAGMKFPRKIESIAARGASDTYTLETARPAPTFVKSPYVPNLAAPADATFDASVPAELEVKKAPTGHLLVKPRVNGKDVGWFIMDSGAGVNVLTSRVVKELGLEGIGSVAAMGIGGTVMSSFSRPASITLGRLTVRDPLVIGMDLSFLDQYMGVPIGGVIGYGVFFRSVVELDMVQPRIALYDPRTYDQSRAENRWQRLYQNSRISCVEAEFEGHRGIFKLDTGAAGSAISIHAPTVERLKLLQDRETSETQTGGVGGMVPARKGELRDFTLGGHKLEKVSATFATTRQGAFNADEALGNIGEGMLRPFRLVFDYQNHRIAFVKREAAK